MLPLILQANVKGWPVFRERKTDKAFRVVREKVFKRDDFACQYCGFQAKKYQQILNKDGDYFSDSTIDNYVTACVLCAQCQFLGCGNFGTLIYLPEYTQIELNHLSRVLFCAMQDNSYYQELAKTLYRSFRNRSKQVESVFGEEASDSLVFGQSMIDVGIEPNEDSEKIFKLIRLLPFKAPLEKPIEYWSSMLEMHW